eukprot:515877_1
MRIYALMCMLWISLFCLLPTAIHITWTTLPFTTPLPSRGVRTALDVNTDLVWLLGGYGDSGFKDDIYQWNMTSGDSFTHIGALSCGTYAGSQDWVIRDNIIYWIRLRSIYSFNMTSAMEIGNDLDATFPSPSNDVCGTTDNDKYLIIVGGRSVYSNNARIYNFETNAWLSNIPKLNEVRYQHTCHVYNGSVYAIAGRGDDLTYLKTVEKFNLNTLSNWTTSSHKLITGRYRHRSVLINDFIVVTGGSNGTYLKSVEIISMLDDSITRATDLNNAVSLHGIIRGPMNNVIIIGGETSSGPTNAIQVSSAFANESITDLNAETTAEPNTEVTDDSNTQTRDDPNTETTDNPNAKATEDPDVTSAGANLSNQSTNAVIYLVVGVICFACFFIVCYLMWRQMRNRKHLKKK